MERTLYKELATAIGAIKENSPKKEAWNLYLDDIVENYFPHGSGFDSGCTIDIDRSNSDKIVINSAFHAMDDNGYYCGWNNFSITVKPSLRYEFDLTINMHGVKELSYGLKDYILETFYHVLREYMKKGDNISKFL